MKATFFLLVIVAAIFSSVYADWNVMDLENGVYTTGIVTPLSTYDCQYARLTVPEGTTIVQIDVETSETNYVGVSAGFNFAPASETNNQNTALFTDNNVYAGSNKRYLLCTFDPSATFGAQNKLASPSVNSAGYCAATVPNLERGGDVYVCLSTYSTQSLNVSIAITHQNSTNMGKLTTSGAAPWTVPATGDTAATQKAWSYWVYVPINATYLQVTTSDSYTVIRTAGLWTNAYTTGNSLYYGDYQVGRWYNMIVISASSTSETLDFTVTENCDGYLTAAATETSGTETCYNIMNATSTAANTVDVANTYSLYRYMVPMESKFYTVNVTLNTTAWSGYISFSGVSYFSMDSAVNAAGTFSTQNDDSVGFSTNSDWSAVHYIAGGTMLNIVVQTSSGSSADFMITAMPEMMPGITFGTETLDGSAAVTVTTVSKFFVIQNFTVEEGKAVNVTVDMGTDSTTGITVVDSNMVPVTGLGYGYTWSTAQFYAPNWPAGTYMIVVSPYPISVGGQTVTFNMVVTDSPSESAAGVATYSLVLLVVSILVALF